MMRVSSILDVCQSSEYASVVIRRTPHFLLYWVRETISIDFFDYIKFFNG